MSKSEFARGRIEARQHIPALRERWPAAFPSDNAMVRPLALRAAADVAGALGWSVDFARGVVGAWKSRAAYCTAILRHRERVDLDGAPTGDLVDDGARSMAAVRLAGYAAAKAKAEAVMSPPSPPKPTPKAVPLPAVAVPPVAKPSPPPPSPAPPSADELRARVRASLARRAPQQAAAE